MTVIMTVKSEHSHVFPECPNFHMEHVSPTRSERVSCTMWLALNKAVPLINSYATLQIMVAITLLQVLAHL